MGNALTSNCRHARQQACDMRQSPLVPADAEIQPCATSNWVSVELERAEPNLPAAAQAEKSGILRRDWNPAGACPHSDQGRE
jgi:hypothetical protein